MHAGNLFRNDGKIDGEWAYSMRDAFDDFREEFLDMAAHYDMFSRTLQRMVDNYRETRSVARKSVADDPDAIYRRLSVLSYFIVLVVIGIPVWWYTTRVYRADLPLTEINSLEIFDQPNKHFGVPLSLEYDVLVTIVNPDPENLKIVLSGEDIEEHMQPFLKTISPIADFIVKSQWLYQVELGAVPKKIDEELALTEEQLPHIITPLEKKLFSHLSPRPCVNLVLYIPHCKAPLYIYDKANQKSKTNAFLSPRWGGIFILNPNELSCERKIFQPDIKTIISTFTTQLRKLFLIKGAKETDLLELKKRRVSDMVNSSKRTLKSLAQLLSEINSIVISDDVARKIHIAVENVALADQYYESGDINRSLEYAKVAFNHSEAAFSDPSLLALLYFPDDQKYAVYIPLFLPVMIPVFMSLTLIKKWLTNRKAKLD